MRESPGGLRAIPFLVFIAFTYLQGKFGETGPYWVYLFKTIAGAIMIGLIWPWIPEMRWRFSWEAVVAGLAVFLFWVGLDGLYPDLNTTLRAYICPALERIGLSSLCPRPDADPRPWNPHTQFGPGAAWAFILMRLLGSTLVVPPLEEVFYRSFLYRYLSRPDFEKIPLGQFRWLPFLLTSVFFGLSHREWISAILCGFVYQGVVCRTKRLGDAMVAHALTNFLLGLWVIARGQWHFW